MVQTETGVSNIANRPRDKEPVDRRLSGY